MYTPSGSTIMFTVTFLAFWALLMPAFGAMEKTSTPYITSASGQRVPTHLIQPYIRRLHSSAHERVDLHTLVYEVTNDGFLRGMNLDFDIFRNTKPLNETDAFTYSINGQNGRRLQGSKIREGAGISVLYDGEHGSILNIWGSQLFLTPLSSVLYPGIFINIHSTLRFGDNIVLEDFSVSDQENIALMDAGKLALNPTLRQGGTCASGKTHYVEVAIAYDNSFCALFSDSEASASAYVQSVINEADVIYRRDTCVSVALVHLEAHCKDPSDPYRSLANSQGTSAESKGSKILDGFLSVWETSRSDVQRDVAMLFSGFEDGTSTAGIAYIGAACGSAGYGWVERGTVSTFVHELGHTLSCSHTSDGVMKGSSSSSDPMFFSPYSITQITKYIDGRSSSCIEPSKPRCDSNCPGKCQSGQCIRMYSASASPGLVPCTPVEGTYLCTQQRTFSDFGGSYTFGVDCPAGFDMLQRESADVNVFCCMPPSQSKTEGVIARENAFVSLIVGDQSIPGYVSDTSLVTEAVLMKTRLVPSCTTASFQSPSSTTLPTTTLPSTTKPSSAITETKIPTATTPPATILPTTVLPATEPPFRRSTRTWFPTRRPATTWRPLTTTQRRTCGETLRPGQTFSCSRRAVRRKPLFLLGAEVALTIEQRSGKFFLVASASRLRFVEFTGTVSTRPKLKRRQLGRTRRFGGFGASSVSIGVDAFTMRTPRRRSECCGENIYVYAVFKVCTWFFRDDCVTTRVLKGMQKIRCVRLCRGGSGRVIPFSRTQICPICTKF